MISIEALIINITHRLRAAEPDVVRVFDYLLARVEKGRPEHGDLDIATDSRDFAEEERQEHADLVVYRAIQEIQRLDRERAPLREAVALENRFDVSDSERVPKWSRPVPLPEPPDGVSVRFATRNREGGK